MRDRDTPLALVRKWSREDKSVYSSLDNCRKAKENGEIDWPDYCPLPINAAYTYLVSVLKYPDLDAAANCAELTACWAWRKNKVVYSFDSDLAAALADQANDVTDTDILPSELLMHLPYPCIYIKAPNLLEYMDGFFAWMDYDVNRNGAELRIQWVFTTLDGSIPQVIHIIPGATLKDCFLDTVQTTMEHADGMVDITQPAESSRIILTAMQLLLYLVADNADISDDVTPQIRVVNSSAAGKRKPWHDKASDVVGKNVGVRIGAAFRRSSSRKPDSDRTGTGSAKSPHMRRGHWHHYWRGPKNGNRELVLRWTAPTMIHAEIGDADNVIVYPVKDNK